MSRINYSIKNIFAAGLGEVLYVLSSFVVRSIFIHTLGNEFLGVNGLFSNILSIISLAELGIGTAIAYSLYKPIAENNTSEILSIMNLFKKIYFLIGFVVLGLGILLLPLLHFLSAEPIVIPNLQFVYILYVFNSFITYFYSYKATLLFAYQRKYVVSFWHNIFTLLRTILQMIVLILFESYEIFLGIQIITTFLENYIISRKVNKEYPFLVKAKTNPLNPSTANEIKMNTRAMIYHRLGGVIVNSTDNLIISKFLGVVEVGFYSNYLLITNAVTGFINIVYSSITASIGNYNVLQEEDDKAELFFVINYGGFWISGFASICLLCLLNPFIELWLGKEYLLDRRIVLIIVINFYLMNMRKGVLTFRDAMGLYWKDRYKALAEAIINLIASIILVKFLGLIGVLIGTTISTLTTCVWFEPYILFRYGLHQGGKRYAVTYIQYSGITILVGLISYYLSGFVELTNFVGLLLRGIICFLIINVLFFIFTNHSKEFKKLSLLINNTIGKTTQIKKHDK